MKIQKSDISLTVTEVGDRPIVVIADVHGYGKTLLKLIEQLPVDALLVFVGDLIDRGPNSRLVVETVMNNNYLCVKGNHEDMMVEVVRDYQTTRKMNYYGMWFQGYVGGWETIENYRFHEKDEEGRSLFELDVFQEHAYWMNQLPIYIEFPDNKNENGKHLVVSHSSVARDWHNRNKDGWKWMFSRTVLWQHLLNDPKAELGVRNPKKVENIFNVFGHTPIAGGPKIGRHFAAIDNGVYSSPLNNKGHLVAFEFPSGKIYKEERKD